MPAQAILLFPHIPKTAGSTLGHAMHRQYPTGKIFQISGTAPEASMEKFRELPIEVRDSYRCISGHMPFGLHDAISVPFAYTTIVRDPVERLVSHYHHVLRDPDHYLHSAIMDAGMSLLDYVGSSLSRELTNDQTRILSGMESGNTPEAYGAAIDHVERFFPVVGLTMHFDESLLLMKEVFSWRKVFYSNRKVSANRDRKAAPDPAVTAVIRERNANDLRLYEFARTRLDQQIAARGASFQRNLFWFRRLNNFYNRMRSGRTTPAGSLVWSVLKKFFPVRYEA